MNNTFKKMLLIGSTLIPGYSLLHIMKYTDEIKKLKISNNELFKTNNKLSKTNEIYISNLNHKEEELNDYKDKLRSERQKYSRLNGNFIELQSKIDKLTSINKKFKQNELHFIDKINNLEKKSNDDNLKILNTQISSKNSEINELKNRFDRIENENKELKSDNFNLKQENKLYLDQVDKAMCEIGMTSTDCLNDRKDELKNQEVELDIKEIALNKFEQSLNNKQDELDKKEQLLIKREEKLIQRQEILLSKEREICIKENVQDETKLLNSEDILDKPKINSEINFLNSKVEEEIKKIDDEIIISNELTNNLNTLLENKETSLNLFDIKNSEKILFNGDLSSLNNSIETIKNTSNIENFLINSNIEEKESFIKIITKYIEVLSKNISKIDLDDDDEEIYEILSEKFFSILEKHFINKLIISLNRIIKSREENIEYIGLLNEINNYLNKCSVYTRFIKENEFIKDIDFEDLQVMSKKTIDEKEHNLIFEVEMLPYYLEYINDLEEIEKFNIKGNVTVYSSKL